MKKNDVPPLKIALEFNRKFKTGYQVRIMTGSMDNIHDEEPYTLYEAGGIAGAAIEAFNEVFHTTLEPHEVLAITDEALRMNASSDLTAMRMLKDIESGKRELIESTSALDFDQYNKDCLAIPVEGEERHMLSARGIVKMCMVAWKEDKKPKALTFMRGYCRLLAGKGYGGGASEILSEIKRMTVKESIRWIEDTHAKFIGENDQEITALLQSL